MSEEAILQVSHLGLTFPGENGGLHTLQDVTFSVQPQEFLAVLGPSGSGKTTLLRVLAGLLTPTTGGVEVHGPGGKQPRVGLVFQQANLMPWRTVMQNITLPLELEGTPLEQAQQRAEELIDLVGLQGFENAWPRDLSGGMAQRVALARSFIQQPDLLLLDEPFGSLDALTRERMGTELLNLWQARRTTVILVTHSIAEALMLSDRVLVISQRPGTVILEMPVELPRPRDEEMRYTPSFGVMANQLRGAIGQS